jgi:hypothetical protein
MICFRHRPALLAALPLVLLSAVSGCDSATSDFDEARAGSGGSTAGRPGTGGAGTSGAGAANLAGGAGGPVTPARNLPPLHVEGNQIKDPAGNVVILRGVALIDLGATELWEGGVRAMIDRLTKVDDPQGSSPGWYPRVVRFAVYPAESEFSSPLQYQTDPTRYYETVLRPAVDYAKQKGLYAIIDWHHIDDTTKHVASTNAFWADTAPRFANDAHVLFELFNEPINAGNWPSVRADMQSFYNTVRSGAPNNLVLVGTPNWCQVVAPTATAPIDGTNIVYVAHMYPQHWANASLRNQIVTAAAVHPVFLTEWGFQSPSNMILNGTISSYGAPFKQFVEEQKLSWTAWCASSTWGPPLFNDDYSLRVGEGEMGGFTKDWLYEKRDSDLPAP